MINIARENILTYTAIGEEKMAGINDILYVILGPQANLEAIQTLCNMNIKDLFELTIDEMEQAGLTKIQALTLHSSILLSKRYITEEKGIKRTIRSPEDAADYLMEDMRNLNQEHFVVLFLNVKNQIIKRKTIFVGSLNASIVHPREIFREAVKCSGCASIIVAHNHPSGNPQPSPEDIEVTKRLQEAGDIVGQEVLDHLIIGDRKSVSLKEKGYM